MMDIADRLTQEHAGMFGIIDKILDVLAEAEKCEAAKQPAFVEKRLPELQRDFLRTLKEHERVEREIFRKETPALDGAVDRQHLEIEEVFKIASALIYLKDPGNLYAIHFAMKRIQESLKDHFAYEERVIFPLLRKAEGVH